MLVRLSSLQCDRTAWLFPGRLSMSASIDSLDHGWASREDGGMKKLLLVLLFGCAACTTQAHDPASTPAAPGAASADGGNILADIQRAIGTPACGSNAECRTLPVGAKACGGPDEYLAWSTRQGNEAALRALSERSKTARQEEIKRTGEMSICIHRPDPGASCVAGTCQLNTASPAV